MYLNWCLTSNHIVVLSWIQTYQHQHNKQMSCPAMAQLLSNTLYYKRFFPYYAFNVLGGLDSEGKLLQDLNVIFMYSLCANKPNIPFVLLLFWFNFKLQARVVSSPMMLLVPTRELDILPKVLVPRSSCPFWITSWSLPALCYCQLWCVVDFSYGLQMFFNIDMLSICLIL